jgi:hypothetical protein
MEFPEHNPLKCSRFGVDGGGVSMDDRDQVWDCQRETASDCLFVSGRHDLADVPGGNCLHQGLGNADPASQVQVL